MGVAFTAALAEFLADKVPWVDSLWDTVHTVIRPLGGALLALAVVDAQSPAWQAVAFLLGGGAALVAHGGKASVRAVINTSPEPVTNIAASTAEDVATGGLLALAFNFPVVAGAVALGLLALALWLLLTARTVLKRLFGRGGPASKNSPAARD